MPSSSLQAAIREKKGKEELEWVKGGTRDDLGRSTRGAQIVTTLGGPPTNTIRPTIATKLAGNSVSHFLTLDGVRCQLATRQRDGKKHSTKSVWIRR